MATYPAESAPCCSKAEFLEGGFVLEDELVDDQARGRSYSQLGAITEFEFADAGCVGGDAVQEENFGILVENPRAGGSARPHNFRRAQNFANWCAGR